MLSVLRSNELVKIQRVTWGRKFYHLPWFQALQLPWFRTLMKRPSLCVWFVSAWPRESIWTDHHGRTESGQGSQEMVQHWARMPRGRRCPLWFHHAISHSGFEGCQRPRRLLCYCSGKITYTSQDMFWVVWSLESVKIMSYCMLPELVYFSGPKFSFIKFRWLLEQAICGQMLK